MNRSFEGRHRWTFDDGSFGTERQEDRLREGAAPPPEPHPRHSRASLARAAGLLRWRLAWPIALSALAHGAVAQNAPAASAAAPAAPSLLPLILGFIVVLALIPAAAWIMRRSGLAPRSGGGALRIGGQLALGPRERVVIVEAGDRRWLIGVAPSGITRLGTLPPAAAGSDSGADGAAAGAGPAATGFADLLRRFTPNR